LEYYDIAINPHKFKMRVKLPRVYVQYKESITREMIIKRLENCANIELKTYLICLAVTGARATEMCSIRLKDIEWDNYKINIRAEFSKTQVGRFCFITEECCNFLKAWIDHKYRKRRVPVDNSEKQQWVSPRKCPEDLVFSSSFTREGSIVSTKRSEKQNKLGEMELVGNLYSNLSIEFAKVIDQLNIGYEDKRKRRHVFTLHSLRRYVRTLISDLGYQDFAIWTIGHASSTYWRKSEKEKYTLFKKIEPHLLLLDQTALSRRHADTQSRLETMEQENRGLQEKYEQDIKSIQDKMNHIMEMIQENPKVGACETGSVGQKE
jgi:integrase